MSVEVNSFIQCGEVLRSVFTMEDVRIKRDKICQSLQMIFFLIRKICQYDYTELN